MQITDHVHAIKIPFQITVNPEIRIDRFVYVYLIYGEKIYLIDSAVASAKDTIFEYIKGTGRSSEEIDLLMLTHSHPDHIGAAHDIKNASGCMIAAHKAEQSWIEDVELQSKERPVPGFNFLVGGSVAIDTFINDGDTIQLDHELSLKAYHTPGHSIGSLSFYLPNDKTLFSGDVIPLKGDIPIYEDADAITASVKRLQGLPDVTTLLSSWADPCSGDQIAAEFKEALEYVELIDALVKGCQDNLLGDPLETCRNILLKLGVPVSAANSLVMKSLMSHLRK